MPTTLGRSQRLALLGLLLGVALGALEAAVANTALPAIAASLGSTPAASIWVLNAYQLAVVASLLPLRRWVTASACAASFWAGCCFSAPPRWPVRWRRRWPGW